MKPIPIILLILAAAAGAEYYPSRFEEGHTFSAKETILYTVPSDTSAVITLIPPGEFLEITEFAEETFTADSCQWGWYGAEYRQNNTVYTGFVQDRDLAFTHTLLGADTLFVFRLSGFNTADNAYEGEISVITDGEVIFTQAHRPQWTPWGRMFDYDVESRTASSEGFTGAKDLIFLYFGLEGSGLECREDMILWTEEHQLISGPSITILDDSDVIRYWTEVILPTTPGGHNEQVEHHFLGEEFNLETGQWESVEDRTLVFRWTGHGFEEEQAE